MIYLIGGPPRCGKTIVARQLAKKQSTSWISTDTLESVVARYVPDSQWDSKFPKSVIRTITNNSNDEMYDKHSAEEIVSAYRQQAKTLHKGINVFAETILKDGDSFILEGHQIQPQLIADIQNKYPEKVKAVILVRLKVDIIIKRAKEHTRKGDWFVEKTKEEKTYGKIAKMIRLYGEQLQREAEALDIPVINMDENFQKATEQALSYLGSS